MRALLLAAACVLAACTGESPSAPDGQSSADIPDLAGAPAEEAVLSCADFAALTPTTLAERFGAENISLETRNGAEGDVYEATIVFADDPAKRMEIVWDLDGQRLATVIVRDQNTRWRGREGHTIGSTLADVERMNGRAFQLYGFGWDFGGWASDWNGGALQYAPTCRASMRFTPRGEPNPKAAGDREFPSDDAAIRAADPVVSEFGLTFPTVN